MILCWSCVQCVGELSFHLIDTKCFLVRGKNCTNGRAACAAQNYFLIQPFRSLIYDVVVAVAVVISLQNSLIGSAAHASSENAHGSPSVIPWLSHLFCTCANFLARLQGSGWRRGARRTGFYLFLAYTKRISRNDPWDMWSNLHLFIANVLEVNSLCNNKGQRWHTHTYISFIYIKHDMV